MTKYIFTAIIFISTLSYNLFAQKDNTSSSLFTYGDKAVSKSEFLRMYVKNLNKEKIDFSEKALREYLTLYARFKMKVSEAEKFKMDTLPNIQNELSGYKKQLAKTYLTDKNVTEKLVSEAYERKKKDIRIAHILIPIVSGSEDTIMVYKKIDSIYQQLQNGADFSAIAKTMSTDKQSAVNGGDIGFITSMQMIYPFENVAYSTPKGTISKPFRTIYGYHIIKKLDERKARGDIQVAQVLIATQVSKGIEGDKAAKEKVDSIYTILKKGKNFDKIVAEFSDDKFSKNTNGVLPTFSVGQMVPEFEDASFELKNIGDLSIPVKTKFGYHIIKLLKKSPLQPFDSIKNELVKKVEKDGRIEVAKQQFTESLKKKLLFKEYPSALSKFIKAIPDTTLSNGTFKANDYKFYNEPLFEIDKSVSFTQSDYANYIENYTKGKMHGSKESALKSLLKNYTDKVLYDYQENKLMSENEEYRNLLTEYRDGIMLFELTDKLVWNKAATDTIGLKKYYEDNQHNYSWSPSIKAEIYRTINEEIAKKVIKELNSVKPKTHEEIAKSINTEGLQDKVVLEIGKFEKSRFPVNTKFIAGKYCPYYQNEDKSYSIVNVLEIYDQPTQKSLAEARGYVLSDYQSYLENRWYQDLERNYPLKINESVLKSIIKK